MDSTSIVSKSLLRAIATHISILILLYVIMVHFAVITGIPNSHTLLHWDAMWYMTIRNNGYYYISGRNNPMAFFPLFPLLWKLTGAGTLAISIINLIFFYISFYFLGQYLKLDTKRALLYISNPGLVFCFIPYSESIFFMGSVLLLIGFEIDNRLLTISGLFIIGLTRSISIVFIAVFCFLILTESVIPKWRNQLKEFFIYVSIPIVAYLIVWIIQFCYTGKWAVMLEVQETWHRKLSWAVLPFTTVSGMKMLWFDGLALYTALLSTFICFYYLIHSRKSQAGSKGLRISAAYIAAVGFLAVFYSGKHNGTEGTSLYSLNRFIFATPYFIFLAEKAKSVISDGSWPLLKAILPGIILLSVAGILLLLGAYQLIFISTDSSYCIAYFLTMALIIFGWHLKSSSPLTLYMLITINVIVQVLLLNAFVNNHWIG